MQPEYLAKLREAKMSNFPEMSPINREELIAAFAEALREFLGDPAPLQEDCLVEFEDDAGLHSLEKFSSALDNIWF